MGLDDSENSSFGLCTKWSHVREFIRPMPLQISETTELISINSRRGLMGCDAVNDVAGYRRFGRPCYLNLQNFNIRGPFEKFVDWWPCYYSFVKWSTDTNLNFNRFLEHVCVSAQVILYKILLQYVRRPFSKFVNWRQCAAVMRREAGMLCQVAVVEVT